MPPTQAAPGTRFSRAPMRLVATFHSISAALLAENAAARRGIRCAVIPVPRALGSSCGYALEAETEDPGLFAGLLRETGADWEAVWRRGEDGFRPLERAAAPPERE